MAADWRRRAAFLFSSSTTAACFVHSIQSPHHPASFLLVLLGRARQGGVQKLRIDFSQPEKHDFWRRLPRRSHADGSGINE